jgi:small subunit ribosomal protein S9
VAETTAETPIDETETPAVEEYTTETPAVEEYTTETPAVEEYTSESAAARFGDPQPAAGTGRRKNAIARVRIVPGTGKWKINGRTLEGYFPNKVHQQEVNEPFKVLELDNRYDVIARIAGGGIGPFAERGGRGQQPRHPEEGRLPAARRPCGRAQEGGSEEGA